MDEIVYSIVNLTTPDYNASGNDTGDQALSAEDNGLFQKVIAIVVPVFFTMIAILGFVGNVLVIVVVVGERQMRNTTNLLIINLAIADLLFIVFCVPFTAVSYAMPIWPFGLFVCKMYNYILNVTAYASVYTLVFMSLDRYLAVVHPIRSMTIRTLKNAFVLTVFMWVVLLAVNVPVILLYEMLEYPHNGQTQRSCIPVRFVNSKADLMAFYGTFFFFAFLLPLGLVCVLYFFMLKRLLYGSMLGGSQSSESMRSKKRVSKMVVIVVIVFALCWAPIQLMFLIQAFSTNMELVQSNTFIQMRIPATCLAYMNSCVNPILYAFFSENFRKSFKKLLCHHKGAQPLRVEFERTQARALETRTTALNNGNQENCLWQDRKKPKCRWIVHWSKRNGHNYILCSTGNITE